MTANSASKMTWQRFVAIILVMPLLFITISYWGYSFGKAPMDFGLNAVSATLICCLSGLLAGLMFNNPDVPFKTNIMQRGIAGLITGAISIWIFGGYLYLRGFPASIMKIELGIALLLAVLPGLILYRIIAKK